MNIKRLLGKAWSGSVVVNNILENTVAASCPAKWVSTLADYLDKLKSQINDHEVYKEKMK